MDFEDNFMPSSDMKIPEYDAETKQEVILTCEQLIEHHRKRSLKHIYAEVFNHDLTIEDLVEVWKEVQIGSVLSE